MKGNHLLFACKHKHMFKRVLHLENSVACTKCYQNYIMYNYL